MIETCQLALETTLRRRTVLGAVVGLAAFGFLRKAGGPADTGEKDVVIVRGWVLRRDDVRPL